MHKPKTSRDPSTLDHQAGLPVSVTNYSDEKHWHDRGTGQTYRRRVFQIVFANKPIRTVQLNRIEYQGV